MKLRSDMLFLLLAPATRRVVILTERCMFDWWQGEVRRGRVPPEIEFAHAALPADVAAELHIARTRASDEVRARRPISPDGGEA